MTEAKKSDGWTTVGDLRREKADLLKSDPAYRAAVEEADAERRERARALAQAEMPIVSDLQGVGVEVNSVWDLVNTSQPYEAALPVLMEHLERGGYPDRVMESLARAVSTKTASGYWRRLRDLYVRARGLGELEGLAGALAATATAEVFDDLVEVVHYEPAGDSRVLLLKAVVRTGRERGWAVIEELQSDPVLSREASARLKRRHQRR